MKTDKKRLISLLLCIVLCLTLVPASVFVSAATTRGGDVILPPDTFPTKITKVELTVEPPTEGKLYSDSLMVPTLTTAPANAAEIIVENLCWYNADDGSYFTGVFEADTVYAYEIYLKPKDGYCFEFDGDDYQGTILANGSAPKYTECSGLAHDILEVSVLVTCKPDDSDFTITFDPNGGTGSMEPATFSKGDIYTLPETCGFTAPEGMEFGGAWEVSGWEGTWPAGTTWSYSQFEKNTVLKPVWVKKDRTEITKVDVSGITAPAAGKTAAECSAVPIVVTIPADSAGYDADSLRWFTSDWRYFDGTFAPGQTYFCEVCLRAAEDYKFSKDDDWNYTGEVMINGANEYAYAEPNAEGTLLYVCKGFTLEKEDITEIELTIGAPTVGKTGAECMLVPEITTTPADAAEFKVEYSGWYNGIGIGAFTGTFEAGKEYVYEIGLVPKDGYKFPGVSGDYQGTVLVNGKEALYAEACADGRYALIGVALSPDEASFTDITEIELTIGAPTVGKTGAECMLVPEITTTPADAAEFKVEYSGWYNGIGIGAFTGTFEAGKEYVYEIGLVPKDGYKFPGVSGDYQGTVLVNGKEALYAEACADGRYALIGVALSPDEASFTDITDIKLTVEAPIAGKAYSECYAMPVFETRPADAAEIIEGSLCWYNPDGSYFTGTFEAGKQYAYYMEIKPKDGYQFEFDGDDFLGNLSLNCELLFTECTGAAYDVLAVCVLVTATDPCEGYTDINRGSWYHKAADFVIANGYMGSTSTKELTFEPDTKVSRAMVASILYRICGSPAVEYSGKFTDVKEGAWYTKAIEWCAQNGLASGYTDGTFKPNATVSRQELAVFMYKLADHLGRDVSGRADLSGFADSASVPAWSEKFLQWAVSAGIISGQANGGKNYLKPADGAKRCEFASILMRFVSNPEAK